MSRVALTHKTPHIALPHFSFGLPSACQVEHMDNERQLRDMGTEIEELQTQLDRLRNEFMVNVCVFGWDDCLIAALGTWDASSCAFNVAAIIVVCFLSTCRSLAGFCVLVSALHAFK